MALQTTAHDDVPFFYNQCKALVRPPAKKFPLSDFDKKMRGRHRLIECLIVTLQLMFCETTENGNSITLFSSLFGWKNKKCRNPMVRMILSVLYCINECCYLYGGIMTCVLLYKKKSEFNTVVWQVLATLYFVYACMCVYVFVKLFHKFFK